MKKSIQILFASALFGFTANELNAQVAINNTAANPDASAILDLNTGNTGVNKGFLAPQVVLTSVSTAAPVTSPATGLIVYSSSAPTGGNGTGYYYWTGSAWASLNNTLSGSSGTNNYVVRWTPNGTTLGKGVIQDNGTSVGINGAPENAMLFVNSTRAAGDSVSGLTYGLFAYASDPNGDYAGVVGQDNTAFGVGVEGTSINGLGVFGNGAMFGVEGYSPTQVGVKGTGGTYGGFFGATAGQGVYSNSSSAAGDSSIGATYGVYGSGTTIGVYGTSSYIGIYGKGATYGGYFTSTNQAAVYGTGVTYGGYFNASAGAGVSAFGTTYGGEFTGSKGPGVSSISSTAAGDSSVGKTYGVYGLSTSNSASEYAGVYGAATNGYGVWGQSTSNVGVYGGCTSGIGVSGASTTGTGVYGNSTNGVGIYGHSGNNYGVEGLGYGSSLPGSINSGTGNAFAGTNYGLYAAQTTSASSGVAAIYAVDASSSDYVEVNAWTGGTHYKVYSNITSGSVTCAAVDLSGQKVLMHCPETPEFYYEDYGEGQLVNGKVHIDLDAIYANNVAISSKHPLRVFIQLEDNENCKGVVVKNKTASGFDVVELDGGTSNTPFEWHIICNVKDAVDNGTVNHVQDLRFEKADPAIVNKAAVTNQSGSSGKN